ncbi:MBL fold metallo-hydrolase [Geothrix sp. PMB-07]|uniref:MBL fold metallo-hydrolase n=1 Tax=Geothrix sp. PMB-07 TaxID=3068640 RepID=UPI00274236D5|nr:MBL fold metallo-hydrolase [Geothrix sp. PMB-07]WLT32193.1 MBL fold metallo-hydrolase [Geothrix sp. PMB-07]
MRLPFIASFLLCGIALSQPAVTSTPVPLKPIQVGQLKVWALRDGLISLEGSLLSGITPTEVRRLLGGKDAAATPVNTFLVKLPGKTVLVDTGIGKDPEEDSGHLSEGLAAAGVTPTDIDLIVITHYHFDHIGGLLKADGSRAFPKARLCVPRSEQAFWFEDEAKLPERLRGRIPKLKAIFAAYEAAGAFLVFEDGAELTPGLRSVSAHGHTGGHTVYAFTSGGRELWCIGDLIHFGAVQIEHPEVGISFDLAGAKAIQVRQDLFRKAAQAKVVLAGAHLPELVQLEAKGTGFVATPVR